jgi:hypothetical protein
VENTNKQTQLGSLFSERGTKRNHNNDAEDNPNLPAAQLASSGGDIQNNVVDLQFGGANHWVATWSSETGKE